MRSNLSDGLDFILGSIIDLDGARKNRCSLDSYAVCGPDYPKVSEKKVYNYDIIEDDKQFFFIVELPGVAKNEVKVSVENNELKISYEKKPMHYSNFLGKAKYHISSRSLGTFTESFRLHDGLDHKKTYAKLENGILIVTIEKLVEETKTNKIDVTVE